MLNRKIISISTRAVIALAISLSLYVCPGYSEPTEQPSNVITLNEAIAAALKDNHRVRAGKWAVEALKKDVSIAWGSLLPKIEIEEAYTNTNNPTYFFMSKLDQGRFTTDDLSALKDPAPINNYRTNFQFEMPVFSMKAYIAIGMAALRAEGRAHEQTRLEETIVLNVFKAYTGVKTAKAYKAAASKGLEDAAEHLRIARARLAAGTGLHSDLLQAQAALSEAQMRVVTAGKNLNLAKRSLGLMIGSGESYDSADEKFTFTAAALDEYLSKNGALRRADVLAMEKNHETAKKSVELAKAQYLPTIALGGSYQLNEHRYPFGDEGKSYQIGVFMKLNVFDGMRRESQWAKARFEAAEAAEHLEGMKKQAAYEVYEAFMSVDEAQKRLYLSRNTLSAAEEGLRLIEKRYANSLAPMVSLLDAQAALDKARADAAAAEGQYLVSVALLEYTGGRIFEFFGIDNSGRGR
jgi:outer membrane protein TolC